MASRSTDGFWGCFSGQPVLHERSRAGQSGYADIKILRPSHRIAGIFGLPPITADFSPAFIRKIGLPRFQAPTFFQPPTFDDILRKTQKQSLLRSLCKSKARESVRPQCPHSWPHYLWLQTASCTGNLCPTKLFPVSI